MISLIATPITTQHGTYLSGTMNMVDLLNGVQNVDLSTEWRPPVEIPKHPKLAVTCAPITLIVKGEVYWGEIAKMEPNEISGLDKEDFQRSFNRMPVAGILTITENATIEAAAPQQIAATRWLVTCGENDEPACVPVIIILLGEDKKGDTDASGTQHQAS